jgi:hypothetical protein
MLPTAIELYNDINFLKKRVREQMDYMDNLDRKYLADKIDDKRYTEIHCGALHIFRNFKRMIRIIESGKKVIDILRK